MAIQLSPELEAKVQKFLDSGRFDSVDAVLHTALDSLTDELPIDLENPDVVEKLRGMIAVADAQIASGDYEVLDVETLKVEMRSFLREEGFPAE